VDDVDGHARGLGQPDDPVRGLPLEDRVPHHAVVVGIGLPGRDGLGRYHVDGHPVLGVHHDQPAVLLGLLHRAEDRPVVAVEDAGVGREELEVGHSLGHEVVHLGERVVVDVAHDHVEPVVGAGVALRLRVPRVQALAQRPAPGLDGEVDDRRGAAERRGARAGLERVLGEGPAEWQLHVRVHVDRAGDDVLAGRVDGAVRATLRPVRPGELLGQPTPDRGDGLPVDQHVRLRRPVRVDDGPTRDERAHGRPPSGRSIRGQA
jgi:hypothetical protein